MAGTVKYIFVTGGVVSDWEKASPRPLWAVC